MTLGPAHLSRSLDSQKIAKWLQTVRREATLPSHIAIPIHLGRWSREVMLLLTRPQLSLLCQRIWKKCHHNLPTYLKSLSQAKVTTRFTIFQVAVINFKNKHICVCHTHTSHLFIPTENGMVLSSSHPRVLPNT